MDKVEIIVRHVEKDRISEKVVASFDTLNSSSVDSEKIKFPPRFREN